MLVAAEMLKAIKAEATRATSDAALLPPGSTNTAEIVKLAREKCEAQTSAIHETASRAAAEMLVRDLVKKWVEPAVAHGAREASRKRDFAKADSVLKMVAFFATNYPVHATLLLVILITGLAVGLALGNVDIPSDEGSRRLRGLL